MTEALFHLRQARRYRRSPVNDMTVDAMAMRLSAAIDTLSRLDSQLVTQLFGDDWDLMRRMRNRIAHGYILIDPDVVCRTIDTDLPEIIADLEEWLDAQQEHRVAD